MLALNERTLFYFNPRASGSALVKKSTSGLVETWAAGKRGAASRSNTHSTHTAVKAVVKVPAAAAKSTSTQAVYKSATAPTRTVTISDTSSEIEIVKYPALDQLEDNEEDEREAALSSPIKGQKRLTSEVQVSSHLCWC